MMVDDAPSTAVSLYIADCTAVSAGSSYYVQLSCLKSCQSALQWWQC